ncbi:unnamed protein product [Mycena citricolor]|uniref:MYND-type domain-containing protein n=1 Tax=Mycena citricolor TaxID=2018698 RepID=A0AAD2H2Z0_9AGAR|nr:unnamed protein product [Mycena citricolor]
MPDRTLQWAHIAKLPIMAKSALNCSPGYLDPMFAIPRLPVRDQASLLPLLYRLLESPEGMHPGDGEIAEADYILKTYPVLQSIDTLLTKSLIPESCMVDLWPRIWKRMCAHQTMEDGDWADVAASKRQTLSSLTATDVRKVVLSVLRRLCVSDRWLSGASSELPAPFGIVHKTPGLFRHLVHLWRGAVFDPSRALPYTADLGLLLCSILISNHAAPHVQDEIFDACGGTSLDYAMFVVRHIRTARREKEWHKSAMLPWTVQSLTALLEITVAYSDVLIEILFDIGLAAELVKLSLCLDRLGKASPPVANGVGVMLTLQGPIFTLLSCAKPNPSWVRQALRAGLLPAIAKTNLDILASPGSTSMNADTLFPNQMKLLSDVLSGQLTSYSVLSQLERALAVLEETQLKFPIGPLITPWSRMLPLLKARLALKNDFDSCGRVGIVTCDGPQCRQESSKREFKRCSHCRQAFYCDELCQKTDWKLGTHKLFCGKLGLTPPPAFLAFLAHTDAKRLPCPDPLATFTAMDYTHGAVDLRIRSLSELALFLPEHESKYYQTCVKVGAGTKQLRLAMEAGNYMLINGGRITDTR